MITVTFESEQFLLFPYIPEGEEYDVEWAIANAMQVGVTMRESREAIAAGQTRKVSFRAMLSPSEKAQLDTAIKTWGDKRILIPFWPSQRHLAQADAAAWYGQINLFWNGGKNPQSGALEVRRGSTPATLTTDATTQIVPLMICRFESLPALEDSTPQGWAVYSVEAFQVGRGADNLLQNAATLTNGAQVNGVDVPLLTVPCDFMARAKEFKVRLESRRVGYSRDADVRTFYTHEPRAVHSVRGIAIGSENRYLANLVLSRRWSMRPLWIEKEDAPGTYIYGRFDKDVIALRWKKFSHGGNEICEFSTRFQTLPSEETIPAGETYGTTIGPKDAATLYLYRISNSASVTRWTGGENDVVSADGTYLRRRIEHGKITEKINLQMSDIQLVVGETVGNPFEPLLTQPAAEMPMVEILRTTEAAPTVTTLIYSGRATSISADGPVMQVKVKPLTAWLKSKGPRLQLAPTCSASFGDSRCGLSTAGVSATAEGYVGGALTFSTNLGFGTDDLLGGWVERPMPDGSKQRYTIAKNGVASGKTWVRLIGSLTPSMTSTETGWKVVKTCNRTFTSCQSFSNTVNFRGFPWIPEANPSVVPIRDNAKKGKK